jgi:membrane associated rhomboid family serine protease/Tfp pilus assembly protein PilF
VPVVCWVGMANCVQCGRESTSFSVGELKDKCPECQVRERIERERQLKATRPSTWQLAQIFPVTAGLVAINVLVYIGCAAEALKTGVGSPVNFNALMLLRWGADFGPLTFDHQFWRIFTSMFVHGGLIHVGANMWCFWDFGRIAERIFGRYRFLVLYVLTGIASSVASLAVHPNTISVGASGAIFGVVGALVFPFYRKRVVLPPPVMKGMLRSLMTFIVINLLIGSAVPVIDNAAHVGGLLAGLLLGAIVTHYATSADEFNAIFPKLAAIGLIAIGTAFAGVQHLRRPDTLAAQAELAIEQGNTQDAIARAKEAIKDNPKNVDAHSALARAYWTKGDYAAATKEFQSAFALDPRDADIAGRLGAAYMSAGEWGDAEPVLRQALSLDPQDATTLQNLGITLAAQDRSQEALMYLRQALSKNPNSATANYALGSVLLDQHQYRDALAPLQEAVRLDPNNADYKKTLDAVSHEVDKK